MSSKSAMKLVSMLLGPKWAMPDRVCIAECDRCWTRAEAWAAVEQLIAYLRSQGLRRGDRVLAVVDHDARGVFFLAAASAMGLRLLMPYNLQAAAVPEWLGIVDTAAPDAIVYLKHDTGALQALRHSGRRIIENPVLSVASPDGRRPEIDDGRPVENFVVLFTSGTTGAPKAISISEALICRRIESVTRVLNFGRGKRVFMSGLLNNTTGVIFSFGALRHDALLLVPHSRDVATWPAQVMQQRATHIMLRPVAMKKFSDAAAAGGFDLSSLETVAYGAAAMPRAVLEKGRSLMPCSWVQGYGLSETFGPFCWLDEQAHRDERYREVYCVGVPDAGVNVRIDAVDGHRGVGEVLVKGVDLMDGYVDVSSGVVTPPEEWFRTGDLGCWSSTRDLLLKGRMVGSFLSANGHRIYPEEVETALADVPGVVDAVLVGVDSAGGAAPRPVACVSGTLALQKPMDIKAIVTRTLSPVLSREKWPDYLYAVTTPFPKSANDKVLRAEVRSAIDRAALIEL